MLLVWSALILLLNAPFYVHGRNVEVNWTLDGVSTYRSSPLRTNLGDTLILVCDDSNSNLFIQTEEIQHNQCNASAGSGMYFYNGFCTSGGSIMLTLRENSQNLMNTVNFENDRLYYFASYSTGQLGDAANDAIKSGGQCEDGLKMVVQIGEIPTVPATGGNRPNDPSGVPFEVIIIGASVGVGALLIILGVVCIGVCLCCCCHMISKKKKMDVETVDGAQPIAPKSSTIAPVSSSTQGEEISNVNGRDGKNLTVNGKKNGNSPIETKKPHKQDEVPRGKQGPASNKQNEKLTIPKPEVEVTAKTNGRYTAVSTTTTQARIGPTKAMRNGTNNSTTQNKTGAASSPSQNKASRGDKTTVNKGTVQSAAKSSVAGRDKPAAAPSRHAPPPPSNAMKRDRVQARSSVPPSQSLPPSSAPTKHERIQVKSSLPPSTGNTRRDLTRTQKSTDKVSYKTRDNAVNINLKQ